MKYECTQCGSTRIFITEKIDDNLTIIGKKYICRDCNSTKIQFRIVDCVECHTKNLIYDDARHEIVCRHCGLVQAGAEHGIDYSLGFLLKRPNNYKFS